MKKLVVFMSILIFTQPIISYAGEDDIGICTAEFLKIGQGPRIVAMGGAGVAITDDVNATYWNPAGLIQLELREITAARTTWFENINTNYLGFAQPLPPINKIKRAMGISLTMLNAGGIDGRDNIGNKTAILEVDNLALSLSYALELRKDISCGFNVKTIKQDFGGNKGTGMAVDIGLLTKYTPQTSFGLNIQNLGPKFKTANAKNDLPLTIKLGAGYKPELFGENTLIAIDIEMPKDNDLNFCAGAEYFLTQRLGMRLGYNKQAGYSIGVGFKSTGEGYFEGVEVEVDYAFVSHDDFNNSQRFSFITKF
ncbi:MAG: PorV/PorQ family protein [bacterium]|nr:PorV/PorQ family protein [bacterium]